MTRLWAVLSVMAFGGCLNDAKRMHDQQVEFNRKYDEQTKRDYESSGATRVYDISSFQVDHFESHGCDCFISNRGGISCVRK